MMEGAMAALEHQSTNAATQSRSRGMQGAPDRMSGSRAELASRTRASRNLEMAGGGDRGRANSAGLSRKNSFGEHQDKKSSSSNSSSRGMGVSAVSSHHSGSRDRRVRSHHRGEGVAESAPRQELRRSSSGRKVIRRSSSGVGMGEGSGSVGGSGSGSGSSVRERRNSADAFTERTDGARAGGGTSASSRRSASRSPRRPHEVRAAINLSTGQKRRSRGKNRSGMNSGGGGSSSSGPGGSSAGGSGSSGQSSDRSSSPGNPRPTSARRQAGDMAAVPGQRGASGKGAAPAVSRPGAKHASASVEGGFARSSARSSHPGSRGPSAAGNSSIGRDGEVSSSLNRDGSMSPSQSPAVTTGATSHQQPPSPQSKTPSASSSAGSFSSNGMPDPEDLTSPDIRDPTAPGISAAHASPISRAAAAAARGGGTFSALETNQVSGGDGSGVITGVQLTTHTRLAGSGDRGRRARPPQVFHVTEGEGEPPEGQQQQQQRSRDAPPPTREEQQRRPRRGERGSRGPGHPRRRGGGPKGLPRGRSMGRAGQRGRRRSASVPQNFHRGPGAFGLAPVEEEREEEQLENDDSPVRDERRGEEEGEEGEEDEEAEDMIFKVVNKDTGEVGDIRDEGLEEVPFDVLPKGFRPSEAWHPELQKHAASKAASHLDLAGAERKTSSKSGGSRFTFKIMRGLKGREHHRDYDGSSNNTGGGGAATGLTNSGSAMGGGRAGNKDRSKAAADGHTMESAMAAAAIISWPKSAKTGPAVTGGRAGGAGGSFDPAIPGDGEGKRQGSGAGSSGSGSVNLSNKASVLLGLALPTHGGDHHQHSQQTHAHLENNQQHYGKVGVAGSMTAAESNVSGAAGPNRSATRGIGGGTERGTSPTPATAVPRSSPGSGERGPTRQEMAAALVAKRREVLKHGRGLMENAILQGVGGGLKPAPLRIATAENDRMDESSPWGGKTGGGGEMLMSPGYQALAAAAVGGQAGSSLSPLRSSMIQSIVSPGTRAAKAEALDKAFGPLENMKPLQKFRAHAGAVLCAEFSRKGHYLATGGADKLVRIWQIGAAEEDSDGPSNREKITSSPPARVKGLERSDSDVSLASVASVVSISTTACGGSSMEPDGTPAPSKVPTGELVVGGRASRVMRGHTGDVVDLSWSPNAFLLSAGRDGSIRLWHPGRLGCVHLFLQNGPASPTSCAFHPRLENSFVTAGDDGKIRVWKITSARVEAEAKMPARTTHVRFSPDGKVLAAGMCGGQVRFLTWETLQPLAQVDLRDRKTSSGVSSIAFKASNPGRGEVLIHGATGRLRLYRIEPLAAGSSAITAAVNLAKTYGYGDKGSTVVTRIAKLKGHVNPGLPVRATLSENGRFAICGSEDGSVHVWDARADAETPWAPRRHVSFNATAPFPGDDQRHRDNDNDDLSLSPGGGVVTPKSHPGTKDFHPLRTLSLSPPVSLSPSPGCEVSARGAGVSSTATMTQQHHDGDASVRARQARRRSSPLERSPVKAAGAASSGKSVGGTGKVGDQRGKGTATATAATGGGRGAKPDGAGSGPAVTLAAFIPKVAMFRFQEANGLMTSKPPQSQFESLAGHQRPSSQTLQSRRLAEIPSIVEVVHQVEDSAPVSRSFTQVGVEDGPISEGRRPIRRSSAPALSPPPQQQKQQQHEEDHKKHHHRHHQQQQQAMGRRSSTGGVAVGFSSSNVDSKTVDSAVAMQSRQSEHHRRKSKKPRGAEAVAEALDRCDLLASGSGFGSGSGSMSRSQSFPDTFVPGSPLRARHRPQQRQQLPPPPYIPQTLGDLLSSSSQPVRLSQAQPPGDSTNSAATPPPPYDPDARWDWDKEGAEEEGGARDSFDIKSGDFSVEGFDEGYMPFGAAGGAEIIDGFDDSAAAASRVVTVEVYRSQGGGGYVAEAEAGVYDADTAGMAMPMARTTKERGRRREFRRNRSEGRGLGDVGIQGRERREDGGSPIPLVEIVTSSPSVSPTRPAEGPLLPSLSASPPKSSGVFPHSPIQTTAASGVPSLQLLLSNPGVGVHVSGSGKGVTIGEKGGDGNGDGVDGGKGAEEVETKEWSWEVIPTAAAAAEGGCKKEGDRAPAPSGTGDAGGGGSAGSRSTALPANSLMLTADSLGNIRIYATGDVLESLSKSAFCVPSTP